MKRVLVGVDGSPESREAAKRAATLADGLRARLTIVYAVPPTVATIGAPELVAQARQIEDHERQIASTTVAAIAREVARPGLEIEKRVISGVPAAALADLAEAEDFEFVAVGHRGRGGLARALLGSVADRLVQISQKPVLVVH